MLHSEEEKLAEFSYRIFQIKFVIFESVLLLCFLYVLYKVSRMNWDGERPSPAVGPCSAVPLQIEQADQTGPFAAPVCDREDGAAMRIEPVQQVMAVLPDGFDDDERGVDGNIAKDFHAALLTIDEAVLFDGVIGVAAPDFEPVAANGGHHGLFDARLGGPTLLIGGESQIANGNEDDRFGHFHILACGTVESVASG